MNEKNNSVLVSILAGIAVGAVLGVLFAPGKGSETRSKIRNRALAVLKKNNSEEKEFQDEFNAYKEETTNY
jgi:gas vesicle protein